MTEPTTPPRRFGFPDRTDLTDRYVFTAARTLPRRQRAEFARDLRERIADEMDARIASGASTPESAEFDALEALGAPVELAAGYADPPPMLIGPRWYATWKRVTILVEWCVLPTAVGGYLLAQAIEGELSAGSIGPTWGIAVLTGVLTAFIVTVIFAQIDRATRTHGDLEPPWSPDFLPAVQVVTRRSRRGDLIWVLAWLAVVVGLVVWQLSVPILDPALWSFWLPYFLVLILLEAGKAILVFRSGWSWVVAIATIVLAVAWVIPSIWLMVTGQLFAPGVEQLYETELDADAQQVLPILFVAGVIGWALPVCIVGVVRALKVTGARDLGITPDAAASGATSAASGATSAASGSPRRGGSPRR